MGPFFLTPGISHCTTSGSFVSWFLYLLKLATTSCLIYSLVYKKKNRKWHAFSWINLKLCFLQCFMSLTETKNVLDMYLIQSLFKMATLAIILYTDAL